MRGEDTKQSTMLCLMSPESVVPATHPIRRIKKMADAALRELSPTFDKMYAPLGRPSIPPERQLKATLLMALYTIRSERMFCEQLGYNLLFRWFLDMDMTEPAFDATVFSKNRQRLIAHDVAHEFFNAVVAQARAAKLMSGEHFTVDGTLIEAWASIKSFKRKDDDDDPPAGGGNSFVDFRGERRANDTHESTTDPDSMLARKGKGKEAKLSYSAHALMENRNGLLVDFVMDTADGRAERRSAIAMLNEALPGTRRITLGADKGYDAHDFVEACRSLNVTPHVAQSFATRRSTVDGRTTSAVGYAVSQRIRKRIEEAFGWMKTIGNFRKTRYIGFGANQVAGYFVAAAYNLVRMSNLIEATV